MSCSNCVHGAFKPTIYCNACTYGDNAIVYKKEITMGECCDNGCMECADMVSGYINIYDIGGMYQSNSGLYMVETDAIETGKMVKGYVATVSVKFKKKVI